MKRGGPLKRKTALKAKTRLKAKAGIKPGSKGLKAVSESNENKTSWRDGPQRHRKPLRFSKLRGLSRSKGKLESAERAFREETIERAEGFCERCGSSYGVEAHHIVSRARARNHSMLHDSRNGAALCFKCHGMVHGAKEMEDRENWLKPAAALDDMKPDQRLAEIDPALVLTRQLYTSCLEPDDFTNL